MQPDDRYYGDTTESTDSTMRIIRETHEYDAQGLKISEFVYELEYKSENYKRMAILDDSKPRWFWNVSLNQVIWRELPADLTTNLEQAFRRDING